MVYLRPEVKRTSSLRRRVSKHSRTSLHDTNSRCSDIVARIVVTHIQALARDTWYRMTHSQASESFTMEVCAVAISIHGLSFVKRDTAVGTG